MNAQDSQLYPSLSSEIIVSFQMFRLLFNSRKLDKAHLIQGDTNVTFLFFFLRHPNTQICHLVVTSFAEKNKQSSEALRIRSYPHCFRSEVYCFVQRFAV